MKKLMIAAAIVCAAVAAQAAGSFTWMVSGSNIPGTSGTGKWSGSATVSCADLLFNQTVVISDGSFSEYYDNIYCEVGKAYTFTLSMTDPSSSYTYTQDVVGSVAQEWWPGIASFTGGNYWSVPEPTSGLLMLLGMAGLALKRRRV